MKLPANNIVVVHRSDGSGTTYIWTDYLSKVSKEWEMQGRPRNLVNWPVGLGGKGNEGVSGLVQQTAELDRIRRADYAIQNKMTYGKVKNAAGEFVQADLASVTGGGSRDEGDAGGFPRLDHQSRRARSYPISSFTWLLIPTRLRIPAKKKAIKDFLLDVGDGQKMTEALSYAPLPKAVVAKELKRISTRFSNLRTWQTPATYWTSAPPYRSGRHAFLAAPAER